MDEIPDVYSGHRLFNSSYLTLANESTSRQEASAVDGTDLYSMNYSAPKLVPFYAV